MLKKVAAIFVTLALIFALGLFFGVVVRRWLPTGAISYNTSTLIKQVQTLSQLVTVKYVLEKVVVFEDAKWYGDNRVLLVAHGVVKAGIDLDRLQPGDVRIFNKKITIALPRARVTDVYLDDHQSQIVERSTGLLRDFDKDLEQNARREAVEDLRRGALQNGILKDASDRARLELTALLYQMGFSEVEYQAK